MTDQEPKMDLEHFPAPDEGILMTTTQTTTIQMEVDIFANDILYRTTVSCQCVAKAGKSATFKH